MSEDGRAAWVAFGEDVGLLFQVVDDILDGDGYARAARRGGGASVSPTTSPRVRRAQLDGTHADTSVLRELVDALTFRTG